MLAPPPPPHPPLAPTTQILFGKCLEKTVQGYAMLNDFACQF